jgi:ribosomal protein S18 acetylase RimI-like enzyme
MPRVNWKLWLLDLSFVVTCSVGNYSILFSDVYGGHVPIDPGEERSQWKRLRTRAEIVLQVKEGEQGWKLVQMAEEHLDDLLNIQYQCFEPHHCEDRQAYLERMRLFPSGNVVLMVPNPARIAAKQGKDHVAASKPGSVPPPDWSKMKDYDGYVIAGYILFQPFVRGEIQDDGDSDGLAEAMAMEGHKFDCYYTHELSISPAFRGKGLTYPLTNYAEAQAKAKGYSWLTLVALTSAQPFWKKNGYTSLREIVYGGVPCYYMEKPVDNVFVAAL